MFKRGIALLLTAILILGMVPATVLAAEEEVCTACYQHKTIQKNWIVGNSEIGQQLLSGGINVALEYPNNAPAYVDTAEEKAVWIADQCRARGITDTWEIALWLHDWLIYNANYDYTYSIYTADGVLLYGTGVCESYTRAYKLLLKQFDIENIQLSADEMNHTWNLVKIDGQWCHIDATWDDPGEGGYENHAYFGLNDELMSYDHDWDHTNPNYPKTTSLINYYPVRMGLGFTTEQEMYDLLMKYCGEKQEVIQLFYLGDDPEFSFYGTLYSWVQKAYSQKLIVSCMYALGEKDITVYLTYPASSGGVHAHQYDGYITYPSCTDQGYTTYYCSCGENFVDDYTNPLGHTGGTATCTQKAVCTRCGETYGEVKAENHAGTFVVKDTKKATCTEAGYTGDTYCSACNVKVGSGDPIIPTGHIDGNQDYICDACYADLCVNHQPEIIPAVPASCTSAGATEGKKCAKCGEVLAAQQVIPSTSHNWAEGNCTTPKKCKTCGTTSGGVVHTYESKYDYKCDLCGTTRSVDMTRPMVDMFRMYDPNSGEHFYTGSMEERENLVAVGWQYEGVGFTFPLTTGKPVYRLYDPVTGEHLYTMDENEKATLLASGWNYEGIAFNSGFENEVPQYRLHNPNATRGAYHFTASIEERDMLISLGWEYQGIGWYSLGA